ncbi:unnamed protein product [Phytophthora lilii]|uniref:Unnamed protein product n=1 Tax=Phytophthora lilii TaxID=2077276 RepID=A0A9W6UEC4_9STRA|nr:unnamed protein product [Phytophthora lilii]
MKPSHVSHQQEDDESFYTSTYGSDEIAYVSELGAFVLRKTSSNRTSAVPTFGSITSNPGECIVGNPIEYISTEYFDWVWEHRIGPTANLSDEANWNVLANKNWLMDHFVHNDGSINYCVRWDTDNQLDKGTASMFKGVLERHYNEWNKVSTTT